MRSTARRGGRPLPFGANTRDLPLLRATRRQLADGPESTRCLISTTKRTHQRRETGHTLYASRGFNHLWQVTVTVWRSLVVAKADCALDEVGLAPRGIVMSAASWA